MEVEREWTVRNNRRPDLFFCGHLLTIPLYTKQVYKTGLSNFKHTVNHNRRGKLFIIFEGSL